MNILIIRLSSLGDIIHTFPMISDIKKNFPDAQIDWLVDNSFQDLVAINPNIHEVINIPLRSWSKHKLSFIHNFRQWKKEIQSKFVNKHYEYIVDSQGLFKSAFLTKLFNGRVYGFGKNSIREKIATIFYNHKIEIGKNHLALQKNRLLAAKIFNYRIDQTHVDFGLSGDTASNDGDMGQNSSSLDAIKLSLDSGKKRVLFFHATSKDSKKYPIKDWVTLAEYLINKQKLNIFSLNILI